MTDRHAAYLVTLRSDLREDDAKSIMGAIKSLRHVIDVKPVIGNVEIAVAQTREHYLWRQKILDLINKEDS